jgi:hypothetical protein
MDDPFITEMDPVRKLWYFNNWVADQNDMAELAKDHAYLLASFSNPEAVKQIMDQGNSHISSDDEFEESSRIVREQSLQLLGLPKKDKPTRRRRRRPTKQE